MYIQLASFAYPTWLGVRIIEVLLYMYMYSTLLLSSLHACVPAIGNMCFTENCTMHQ